MATGNRILTVICRLAELVPVRELVDVFEDIDGVDNGDEFRVLIRHWLVSAEADPIALENAVVTAVTGMDSWKSEESDRFREWAEAYMADVEENLGIVSTNEPRDD